MTFHVGIYPSVNIAFLFNTGNESVTKIKLPYRNSNDFFEDVIRDIFKEIKLKITGKLGCCCIVLDESENETRKDFIQHGFEVGFEKVEIINAQIARYLHATFYSNYSPKNGDIIWIINNLSLNIFERSKDKARYLGSIYGDFKKEEVLKSAFSNPKFDKPPNALLYDHRSFTMPFINNITVKHRCQFYQYQSTPISKICIPFYKIKSPNQVIFTVYEGALLYARFMANDPELKEYGIEKILDRRISVGIRSKLMLEEAANKVVDFQCFESLPLKCLIKLKNNNQENNELIVESTQFVPLIAVEIQHGLIDPDKYGDSITVGVQKIDLPNFDNLILTITIDTNGILGLIIDELHENDDDDDFDGKNGSLEAQNIKIINFTISSTLHEHFKQFQLPKKHQLNPEISEIVGIDLGTSRCCAAVTRKNGIEIVASDNTGERLLPSYVSYDEEKEKCGQTVLTRLQFFAESTVFDVKRFIGKTFDAIKLDKNWMFKIIDSSNKVKIQLQGYGGSEISKFPEEISAVLLKHIKKVSEGFQGMPLKEAVITVPAAFDPTQTEATRTAAILAGWDKVHLLPEPVAAAFAYFIDRPIPKNSTLLLFDLGGGTLDVCIFKITKFQMEIISRCGDPYLGGRDFDNLLIDLFANKLFTDFNIKVDEKRHYKLMQKCQEIKHNLSVRDSDKLDVDDFKPSIEKDAYINITRNEFEKLAIDLLTKIEENLIKSLDKVKTTPDKMDKVLYVGGGCRMPMIKNLLQKIFPNAEHCCEQHPDEVVAIGAAYYANYLKGTSSKNKKCSVM